MTTIAIFTTTRADFGIFIPFLKRIEESDDFLYKLFVGGTHLSRRHGYTLNEIKERGFHIAYEFDYLDNNDSALNITEASSKATKLIARAFNEENFDIVCVLGDRYELLSIVQAAIIFGKPIIHIHGGEITQGAIDEQIRHMITKASHIHFAACDEYTKNIRNMGEEQWRVFNTGSLAIENIKDIGYINKEELFTNIGLSIDKNTVLMTYHPVTLENAISTNNQINNLFEALTIYDGQILITAPNADEGNDELMEVINKYIDNSKYFFIESLGAKRYLSLLQYLDYVIGNSSSGIIEVPYFKIPTINIGSRQNGRIRHKSIIDTDYSVESIKDGILHAGNNTFIESIKKMPYKFGDGNASQLMLDAIRSVISRQDLLIKKMDFPC